MLFKMRALAVLMLAMAIGLGLVAQAGTVEASAEVTKQGDRKGQVWDIQHRLQQLGYYQAPLDGVFGEETQKAVQRFQQHHGLPVDGVVGKNTHTKLHQVSFTSDEIEMMAKLVYGEARGESFEGQVAVAAVVLNRLASPQFPNTVKDVIFEPRAFTAVDDGQYYSKPDKEAYRAVYAAISGWDPTGEALYYFNPQTATSDWIWSRPQIKQIGKHIFAL